MPLNDRRIIRIIMEECSELEERCEGYTNEIVEVVAEILAREREHRVSATSIQKKVNDQCDAAGQFLAKERSKAKQSASASS
ncbi:MAG: hypothetical protein OXF79_01935 [Chloroflexi bacterium]|nr:hypothetical protein [Chloroflexota bacterium]